MLFQISRLICDFSRHTPRFCLILVQGISHWSSWLLGCDSIRMTITQQKSRWSHKNVEESKNPDGGLESVQQRTENDSAPFQRRCLRILEKENFVLRIIRPGAKASSPLTFLRSRSPLHPSRCIGFLEEPQCQEENHSFISTDTTP